MVNFFNKKVSLIIALAFSLGGLSLAMGTDYPCFRKESQSNGCAECAPSCPGCTTYGKCGVPGDSGHCEGPVYDGSARKCVTEFPVDCPGPGLLWLSQADCQNGVPAEYTFGSACVMTIVDGYDYESATEVQSPPILCDDPNGGGGGSGGGSGGGGSGGSSGGS